MYSTTSPCTTRCLLGTFPQQAGGSHECKGADSPGISFDTLGMTCMLDAEFTRFVAETETSLYWFAYRLCRNHAQAQDLVQSAYLKRWVNWLTYGPNDPEHHRNLAYRAVQNVYFDYLRKKSNGYVPTDLADYDAAGESAIDEEFIAAENAREVLAAVEKLPDRLREVITAVYFDGSTVAAFAASEGITPKRASRYHLKALQLLREILGEQ
ncbi:sigma-70 family RNA polymerase sigma factor [Streptomyces sp. NPDC051064]|uniref:sigma-70 family RNA polymerase sigma factor n=1 Tax=Streptomyces sp. NPDC051064 TaxID=3365641 RepID=UPI00379D29AE